MIAQNPESDFEKWSATAPSHITPQDMPEFYQPTWPQYRKRIMVDGEEVETHLDGTETADTVIVKYDHTDEYKKWRDQVMAQSLGK